MGGALKAIETGFIQNEIQNAAYAYQKAVEQQDEIIVGVNKFKTDDQIDLDRLTVDPAIEVAQRRRLSAIRERRDPICTSDLLTQLEQVARSDENLIPVLIECVEKDITLGEICDLLRGIWGEYQPPNFL
jgi:methylmalonyl-CoA mutase N-terminal domain/subunit